MAEFLIKARDTIDLPKDKVKRNRCYMRGDIVVVMPDGHECGNPAMSPAGGGGAKRRGWSLPVRAAFRWFPFSLYPLAFFLLLSAFILWPLSSYPQTTYTLTGNSCGTGLTGDTCVGGLITETYPAGTVVTLTPSPKTGYLFTGWRGDCTGKDTCVLTMTRNMTVMADFKLKPGKVRNLRIAQLRRQTDGTD